MAINKQQSAPAAEQAWKVVGCEVQTPNGRIFVGSPATAQRLVEAYTAAPSPAQEKPVEASVEIIHIMRAALERLTWGAPKPCRKSSGALHQSGVCGFCDGLRALATASSPSEDAKRVKNLSVLIARLCSKDTGHSDQLRKQALDYLKREGLVPSPLRDAVMSSPSVTKEWLCKTCMATNFATRICYNCKQPAPSVTQTETEIPPPATTLGAQGQQGKETGGDWQPIESAPKDGTNIDVWSVEHGRWTGCYWGKPQHECGEAGEYCDSDWHAARPNWVEGTFNDFLPVKPTHWMTIPKPPALPLSEPAGRAGSEENQ